MFMNQHPSPLFPRIPHKLVINILNVSISLVPGIFENILIFLYYQKSLAGWFNETTISLPITINGIVNLVLLKYIFL